MGEFPLVVATRTRSREVYPHMCLHIVLRHAFAVRIHHAEVELSVSVSLFGGFTVPADSLRPVLRHARPPEMHEAEVELSVSISLFGGFTVPADSLGPVLRHAL